MTAELAAPMTPVPYRVRERVSENRDSATLYLQPVSRALSAPQPGEFMMMYAFGIGEIAVSVSGISPEPEMTVAHTVRAVGSVSAALRDARTGTTIGLRGPFGTGWDLEKTRGRDLVLVAGGVGLAPLRPVIVDVLGSRHLYGRVTLIAGARSRDDFLFASELQKWGLNGSIDVHLTVDIPMQGWPGEVGFVTEPLRRLPIRPDHATAYLCGPELMMRNGAAVLRQKGMAASDIRVSLERNMQCGIGWCGHCQLGPLLLCRDGPVVGYDVAEPLLAVKEL